MSTEIQPQLEDIKSRVADLEKAEIKLRIQSVGPRGPIGPAGPAGSKGAAGPQGVPGEQGKGGSGGFYGKKGVDRRGGTNRPTPGRGEYESKMVPLLPETPVVDAN